MSIRARLTWWYSLSMLVVFLVFAGALRTTVRSTLIEEFTTSVENSANAMSGFFRLEHDEYHDVRVTLQHIAAEVVLPDRVIEFVDPAGQVAYRAIPLQQGKRVHSTRSVTSVLPPPVRHATTTLAPDIAPGWTIRVFAGDASLERSLQRIDEWLVVGMPLGILLVAAAGWWLAGRTLRPVGQMADAAERMTANRKAGGEVAARSASARLPINRPDDEIGRLGTRFNALLDQIDGVVSQQRRFLADAAHELRTPVARMLGSVEVALMDPNDAVGHHAALERVVRDLRRTAVLVDQLLQLARADAAAEIRCGPGYVDDVVANAVQSWYPAARRGDVQLVVSALEEAPALLDSVFLDRLVGIFIDNALRYTLPGGLVDVRVWWDGSARLSISDSGVGISDEDRARVFERFYRGANARSMAADGSGLGLPIARWIAVAHGATLELTGRAGGGTVATVVFPRVEGGMVPRRQRDASQTVADAAPPIA
jgi:signal transduction histidine kinase